VLKKKRLHLDGDNAVLSFTERLSPFILQDSEEILPDAHATNGLHIENNLSDVGPCEIHLKECKNVNVVS